jgi:hypothetical protein
MGVKRMRKGVMFFTVDALIAGVILTLTVAFLLSFFVEKPMATDAKFYLDGYTDYVVNTQMSKFTSKYNGVYTDPEEPNPSLPIYQKVLLMTSNQKYSFTTTQSFVANVTNIVIPEHVGVEYKIDDVIIYSRHADRLPKAKMLLTNSMLTFAVDENNVIYGPNVTKITVWV